MYGEDQYLTVDSQEEDKEPSDVSESRLGSISSTIISGTAQSKTIGLESSFQGSFAQLSNRKQDGLV